MPVTSSEYVSIAWFKLSECIRRGEKERALSVYRLLVHSLHDEAVAYQLKGDILSIFNVSQEAVQAYQEAALRFEQDGRHSQAAYVHECVILHNTRLYRSYQVLVDWYAKIGVMGRAATIARELLLALISDGYISHAYEVIQTCLYRFPQEDIGYFYELFIQHALQHAHNSADRTIIHSGIAKTIDVYRNIDKEQAILGLFDTLAHIDNTAYQYAQQYHQNG